MFDTKMNSCVAVWGIFHDLFSLAWRTYLIDPWHPLKDEGVFLQKKFYIL